MKPLTPAAVRSLSLGVHRVDYGLYLRVRPAQGDRLARSWVFRHENSGKQKWIGLGSYPLLSVNEAKGMADRMRDAIAEGRDPKIIRRKTNGPVTFRMAAEAFLEKESPSWTGKRTKSDWENSFERAYPVIGDLSVATIDPDHIEQILKKDWLRVPKLAQRVRYHIARVLNFAIARKWRTAANPADASVMRERLARQPSSDSHHASLSWEAVPAFWKEYKDAGGLSADALRLAILTSVRTQEVLGAMWEEIDLEAGIWTIPPSRMKKRREHRVALSTGALEILNRLRRLTNLPFVFPGRSLKKPLSEKTMLMSLRRNGYEDFTPHGFRSSFLSWVEDNDIAPPALARRALAHKMKDKTHAAYMRSDLIERRRVLAETWDRFVTGRE